MSIQLRLRVILGVLLGALLVVSLGAALHFREIAVSVTERFGAEAGELAAAAEMQRLLAAGERGAEFERNFRASLELLEQSPLSEQERERVAEIRGAFEQSQGPGDPAEERALAWAVARLVAELGHEARQLADTTTVRATTAAIGLGILGILALAVGAGVFRTIRRGFLRRLTELDRASVDIQQGDAARRVPIDGDDELARVARALNFALDRCDRSDAEMRGRNREIRALLVALLRQWPRPVAITGIDGEVIASTLSIEDEQRLRSLTPQVRKAAGILLSRGFVSASELETDVSFADGHIVHIRALALGEQRIVGWLTEWARAPARAQPATSVQPAASEQPDHTPVLSE